MNQYIEEVVDAGFIGLCVAAQRFDPNGGAKFGTYAWWWIRTRIQFAVFHAAIRPGVARNRKGNFNNFRRVVLFGEFDQNNPIGHYGHRRKSHFDVLDIYKEDEEPTKELTPELDLLIDLVLDKRRGRILRWVVFDNMTLKEVSELENISRERVRQLHLTALERLRGHSGFIRALNKQWERRRQQLNFSDFDQGLVGFPIA